MIKKATQGNPYNRKIRTRKMPELLAPAGSFEKLTAAVHYGADAIYCSGKKYSLRAHATNFSDRELKQVITYAHERSVKVYVAVNIFARQKDLTDLDDYLRYLRDIAVDGIIISDPGILLKSRELIPDVPVHLSTQANVTNAQSALFWKNQGVSRLNMARELSMREIGEIKKALAAAGAKTKIEVFVHGALCISYSGRCLLSHYLTGRDANRGECAHPCRYSYTLLEEKRPHQFFPVEEDSRGTYIFNSKDLCLVNKLPQLVAAGVDSIKIEGRMKSPYYVGSVVRVYRAALDYLAFADKNSGQTGFPDLPPVYMEEISKVGTRGMTENFSVRPPDAHDMIYETPRLAQGYVAAGIVRRILNGPDSGPDTTLEIELRNPLKKGEVLEYLDQGIDTFSFAAHDMRGVDGETIDQAHPGNLVRLEGLPRFTGWEVNGLLRKKSF